MNPRIRAEHVVLAVVGGLIGGAAILVTGISAAAGMYGRGVERFVHGAGDRLARLVDTEHAHLRGRK